MGWLVDPILPPPSLNLPYSPHIYQYTRALMLAYQPSPAFLSFYISGSDYGIQVQQQIRILQEKDVHPMQQLTEKLHQVRLFVQALRSPAEWLVRDQALTPYEVNIHADRQLTPGGVTR